MKKKATILVVDDNSSNLKLLDSVLTNAGYKVKPADRGAIAIESALRQPPDLVILDIKMPEMDGFEICRRLKLSPRTQEIPIIFISGLNSVSVKLEGFAAGGVDFISKPFQEPEVLARVKTHLKLYQMQMDLEDMVNQRTQVLSQINNTLKIEIEARKSAERMLRYYETAIEVSSDLHYMIDTEYCYQMVNKAAIDYHGKKRNEFIGIPASKILGTKGYEKILPMLDCCFNGETISFEMQMDYKNQGKRDVNVSYFPVQGRVGDVSHVACRVEDITQRKQVERKIQIYQKRLKALTSQVTLVEEKERRSIASDLHDHIGQNLAFSRIQVAKAKKYSAEKRLNEILDELSTSLLDTIRETKTLVFNLSSPLLNELGLGAAVSNYLKEYIEKKYGLSVSFFDNRDFVLLKPDIRAILFRNVKELLANVIRHSKAEKVSVVFERTATDMKIIVEDDGRGFDASKIDECAQHDSGFGLFSIRERMMDYGGYLKVDSQPGSGCRTTLVLPVENIKENSGAVI